MLNFHHAYLTDKTHCGVHTCYNLSVVDFVDSWRCVAIVHTGRHGRRLMTLLMCYRLDIGWWPADEARHTNTGYVFWRLRSDEIVTQQTNLIAGDNDVGSKPRVRPVVIQQSNTVYGDSALSSSVLSAFNLSRFAASVSDMHDAALKSQDSSWRQTTIHLQLRVICLCV